MLYNNCDVCAPVPLRKENILSGRFERAAAYRSMHRFLKEGHTLPDAVFAANDLSALGCIKALQEYHIRVPQDISIMGCDDHLLSGYVTPGLTTIRTHMEELAVEAAVEGSVSKLKQALMAHPLVRDYDLVEALVPELLEANREYLPQFSL